MKTALRGISRRAVDPQKQSPRGAGREFKLRADEKRLRRVIRTNAANQRAASRRIHRHGADQISPGSRGPLRPLRTAFHILQRSRSGDGYGLAGGEVHACVCPRRASRNVQLVRFRGCAGCGLRLFILSLEGQPAGNCRGPCLGRCVCRNGCGLHLQPAQRKKRARNRKQPLHASKGSNRSLCFQVSPSTSVVRH